MGKRNFSKAERAQLAKLAALSEHAIDTVDIPEAPAENWKTARRPVNRTWSEKCEGQK
jgi:hypothetical protein